MKCLAAVVLSILIFGAGFYFGDLQKKCICETCSIDTVFVQGKTVIQEKPKVKNSYAAVNPKNGEKPAVKDSSDHFTDISKMVGIESLYSPCDSIRTYEYSDSAVTIKDSVQGVLLQQTIIYKPAAQIIKTIVRDSAVFKSGFYLGGSAGLNSIRIEGEYLNKSGYSFTVGYDLINKSPVIGIRRKIF